MNKTEGYNGFANYETWAVSLWMNNDQASYEYFRTLALDIVAQDDESAMRASPKAECDVVALAGALRCEFEERSPLQDQATVYTDLVNAALSEVDWYELAEHLLSDITEG